MSTVFFATLLSSVALGANEPDQHDLLSVVNHLDQLAGNWVETSVQYFGQELFDPPATGNRMAFDGKRFTQSTSSGKPFLQEEIKLVAAREMSWDIDLPIKTIVGGKMKTVIVAAIFRPVGKDGLQIVYFDPKLIHHERRPGGFQSTATNGVVLITLTRKP